MNQGATWRQFDARLQGEDHALYQRRVIGWDQAWPFGEVHAQPMAIAARLGAAGAAGDNLIHNVKQLRRGRTRSCGFKCGICGLNQTAVSGGNIRRWAAHGKVAIEIAKIAIMHQACVQHQDISRLERAVVRWRDDIAIAAGRRSTGKIGHPIGAFIQTEALKISKHRCQRLADAGNLRHAFKGAGGNLARGFDLLNLSLRFHQAQAAQNVSIRANRLGQSGIEPGKIAQRHAQM